MSNVFLNADGKCTFLNEDRNSLSVSSAFPSLADAVKIRRRKAQWLVSGMLSLSLLIVAMGIYSSTRTESVSITGYISGIIVSSIYLWLFLCIIIIFLCSDIYILFIFQHIQYCTQHGKLEFIFGHNENSSPLFQPAKEHVLNCLIQSNHYLWRKQPLEVCLLSRRRKKIRFWLK